LLDDFSLSSNKRSSTNNSEIDINDATILSSKTIDFLFPIQKEAYESSKLPALTSVSID